MTRRCRCSIPVAAGPRPGGCGAMRSTSGPGRPGASGRCLCLLRGSQGRASRRTSGDFNGVLQVDGYTGFKRWRNARRRHDRAGVLLGAHAAALLRVPRLHQVAARRRGTGSRSPRSTRSRPRSAVSRPSTATRAPAAKSSDRRGTADLAERPCGRVSSASPLADAIRYTLRHWSGLVVFLDDGRLEIDTNVVERAMRSIP